MNAERLTIIGLLLMQIYMAHLLKEAGDKQLELSRIATKASAVCVDSVKIITKAAQDALAFIKKEDK